MSSDLMTPEEAMKYLRIEKKSTFDHMVATRKIPVTKIGHFNRFRKSLLDRWLEENTVWDRPNKGRKRNFNLIEGGE